MPLARTFFLPFAVAVFAWPDSAQNASIYYPIEARYSNPTDRYPHNIMGSLRAHTDLIIGSALCLTCRVSMQEFAIRLPENLVFEDFAPRLVDLNDDGFNEIVVVESDQRRGSRLVGKRRLRPTL